MATQTTTFRLMETTIEKILAAYTAGEMSARELVKLYLDRIEAYDRGEPHINCVISTNPAALTEADRLDAAIKAGGPVGPLHGIPVVLKDQMDAEGMPTTMGSILFRDYYPDKDSFVAAKLRQAGAIILGKVTLGEMGGGDTHGTLFGSSRNPYDPRRTVGGSSGGSAAAVSANLTAIAIGQEGAASIRRPSTWNGIVGMRPTAGLVSRAGVYGGWPSRYGQLGPMTRTVTDLATLLDVMVGYDAEDPLTAYGYGRAPASYKDSLLTDGLQGARIGILRNPFGARTEPDSEDYKKITPVFEGALADLTKAGATLIDPIEIEGLEELVNNRANLYNDEAFARWMARSARPPYPTMADMKASPDYRTFAESKGVRDGQPSPERYGAYLTLREKVEANMLNLMASLQLDAIVHKSVEHQPTLIDAWYESKVSGKGVPHINTALVYAASMTVPAGFTTDGLPTGITFLGRGYSEPTLIKLAYAYEQATLHRRPPSLAPALPGEP